MMVALLESRERFLRPSKLRNGLVSRYIQVLLMLNDGKRKEGIYIGVEEVRGEKWLPVLYFGSGQMKMTINDTTAVII